MMDTKTTKKKIQLSNIKLSINDNEATVPIPASKVRKKSTGNDKIKANAPGLTESNTTSQIDINISFCDHVGWDGMLIILFCICMSGVFIFITYSYTKKYYALKLSKVWMFLVFVILYIVIILKWLFTWKKMANAFIEEATENKNENENEEKKDSASKIAKAIENIKIAYNNIQVNGEWFLWKLYLSELFESAQQCINIALVYSCSLPREITSPLCLLLAIDCAHSSWGVIQPNTPSRRHKQLVIDTIVDFVCAALPLTLMRFAFQVPISISEMISITLMPTFFMLAKLDDIFEEIVRHRSFNSVLKEQTLKSFQQKRRRESLFEQVTYLEIAEKQENNVPRVVKIAVSFCKGLFALFFFIVGIIHLISYPTNCDETTWVKGCVNKVPFCQSLLMPTCNCMSLRIENDYTLNTLPHSLVDEMTGLRKVYIRNCNLTKLPSGMEQLTEMVHFEVSSTLLGSFDVNILKWTKVQTLHLNHNNITLYNEVAIWHHPGLEGLALGHNNIGMPTNGIDLPSLNFLFLSGNNLDFKTPIGTDTIPNLAFLYLNGNRLVAFPAESLKDNLVKLGISRCSLKSLPSYLSKFKALRYLDARDNNITHVEKDFKFLMEKNSMETYFSGNNVCKADKSLDCEPLCSKTCWSKRVSNDGICDFSCNSEACKFDGGDCTNS